MPIQRFSNLVKMREVLPIIIIFLLLMLSMTQLAIANTPVNIPDPNLRAAIKDTLGKAQGARITPADMRKLKSFLRPVMISKI